MNPLGYYVVPVMAPTEHEKQYHYLRRFIKQFPRGGDIAIFDRSRYGRVLVERVEGYCTEPEWQRSYGEINEMEEDYVNSSGGGIVKFWLEISRDEQSETVPAAGERSPESLQDNGRGLAEPGEVGPVQPGGERHAGTDVHGDRTMDRDRVRREVVSPGSRP